MTATTLSPQKSPDGPRSMQGKTLSIHAAQGINITAAAVAVVGALTIGVLGVAIGWLIAAVLPVWSLAVEGRRKATDRFITLLVYTAFAMALIPLVSLLWEVTSNGVKVFNGTFFSSSMLGVLDSGGGIFHAIMGTLVITAITTLISVPIGIFTAIYLIEYGEGSRLAQWIRFLVDVMTGIPSIVAGLFSFSLFVIIFGPSNAKTGFGGAIALMVLMVPTVVRSTEEMLKLVPNELREASYALGVPKWATIAKVVLPTALAGIVTGVTLAIARVIGETAPLLVAAGTLDAVNYNPFSGQMQTLPVFAYYSITTSAQAESVARGWGAALTLLIIVVVLNLIARLVSYFFSPKGER